MNRPIFTYHHWVDIRQYNLLHFSSFFSYNWSSFHKYVLFQLIGYFSPIRNRFARLIRGPICTQCRFIARLFGTICVQLANTPFPTQLNSSFYAHSLVNRPRNSHILLSSRLRSSKSRLGYSYNTERAAILSIRPAKIRKSWAIYWSLLVHCRLLYFVFVTVSRFIHSMFVLGRDTRGPRRIHLEDYLE